MLSLSVMIRSVLTSRMKCVVRCGHAHTGRPQHAVAGFAASLALHSALFSSLTVGCVCIKPILLVSPSAGFPTCKPDVQMGVIEEKLEEVANLARTADDLQDRVRRAQASLDRAQQALADWKEPAQVRNPSR